MEFSVSDLLNGFTCPLDQGRLAYFGKNPIDLLKRRVVDIAMHQRQHCCDVRRQHYSDVIECSSDYSSSTLVAFYRKDCTRSNVYSETPAFFYINGLT